MFRNKSCGDGPRGEDAGFNNVDSAGRPRATRRAEGEASREDASTRAMMRKPSGEIRLVGSRETDARVASARAQLALFRATWRERDTTIIRPSVSSPREASVVASARSRVDSSSPRRRRARARVARARSAEGSTCPSRRPSPPPSPSPRVAALARSRTPRPSARVADLRPSRRACPAASLLSECASLPPTHARTSSASAALGGGPGGDDSEVLSSEISSENARTPAGPPSR